MSDSKICRSCHQTKMLNEFNAHRKSRDGFSYYCKTCKAIQNKKYISKNPDRLRKQKREWARQNTHKRKRWERTEIDREKEKEYRKRNKEKRRLTCANRRARKKNNKVFKVIDKDLRRLLNDPCIYCGGPAEHVEHLIPISRGGPHGIGNLAPSCAKCNLTKQDKTVYEFKIWRKRITERQLIKGSNLES